MKQAHLIAVNTLIIWGTTVLQMIPPLVMVPFLVRSLGDSGYGEYALIWSLLLAIEQLEASLQSGGIKYGAAFLAQGRIGELNKVLSASFVFSLGLGIIAAAAVVLSGFAGFGSSRSMTTSLVIVAVMMMGLAPTTPFLGIIRAKQRHFVNSLAAIAAQYAGLALTFLWFRLVGPSVEALIAILASTLLVSRLAQLPLAYRLVPGLQNRPRNFDRATLRMIVAFGSAVVVISLCLVANSTGLRWLAGLMVSTAFVAHLSIFLMPGAMMAQVVQAMTITIMPAASAYEASESRPLLRELFLKSTRYTVVLVSAGLVAALVLVRDGLRLWVGRPYEFLAVYVLVNLAGVAVLMSASCAHQMLKGLGALRSVVAAYAVGLVAVPAAIFVGGRMAGLSAYAAVSAGLLAGNTTAAALQLRACGRRLELTWKEFFKRALLEPLAPAAAGLGLAGIASGLGGLGSLTSRAAVAGLAVIMIFGGFYRVVAGADERRMFRDFVRMVRERLGKGLSLMIPRKEDPDV
jgi:O-antigen/teichoic acid export membrane protein